MIKTAVLTNKVTGWVEGIVSNTTIDEKLYPNHNCIFTDFETSRKIDEHSHIVWHDGKEFKKISNDKIFKTLLCKGLKGNELGSEVNRHLSNKLKFNEKDHPDIDTTEIPKIIHTPPPIFEGELYSNVICRLSTESDLDVWETQMIKGGFYSKENARTIALDWIHSISDWPIVTEYKGEIIQIENYIFKTNDSESKVYGGFASHIDRGRPHWFWTILGRKLLECFDRLGIETMNFDVVSKYPLYVDFFKRNYGAKELYHEKDSVLVPLRYNISKALEILPKDPEKKTISGWVWEEDSVLVREYKPEDNQLVIDSINKSWGNNSRKQVSFTNLDRWLNLDNATGLLVFNNGELVYPELVRLRAGTIAQQISLVSLKNIDDETLRLARKGLAQWKLDVGYEISTSFIEKGLANSLLEKWKINKVPDYSSYLSVVDLPNQDKDPFTVLQFNLKELIKAYDV